MARTNKLLNMQMNRRSSTYSVPLSEYILIFYAAVSTTSSQWDNMARAMRSEESITPTLCGSGDRQDTEGNIQEAEDIIYVVEEESEQDISEVANPWQEGRCQ